MRYININDLKLPANWAERAKKLNTDLANAATQEERSIILDNNPIWQELFIPLSNLSKGKCWYSEALEVMSDRDVDHFRPKNKAKNINGIDRGDEDGYWWLAYDYENYRFSSQYSNQRRKHKFDKTKDTGGKGIYFPLFAGSPVAKTKPTCFDEHIMLLDPCDEDDPSLLTFNSKGEAIPNVNAVLDVNERVRVEVSIKLYNLDQATLVELRERVWDSCQRLIDEIRKITSDSQGVGTYGRARVKFLKDEIRKMTKREIELSAVAISCCEENGLHILTEPR
ncbi:hypothetical protein M2T78_16090 [Elizabethkingia ursingii]|uniref:hypothetical protein n=1 Tax=Elizabethkingia ursingii TaxID=1756150 RepID=UPI002013577B|nr:hypothetical protein [Elizabethkingia ursingii]MCL1665787.1 hypothetical protein [Elizabethkingia ursingii]